MEDMIDLMNDDIFKRPQKHEKTYHFFKNPCFACECLGYETDGDYGEYQWNYCKREHGTYSNNSYDEKECDIFLYWGENKKEFPECEAPNKCLRKGYWEYRDDQRNYDCFEIMMHLDDPLVYEFGGGPYSAYAREISHSVADFNSRMRNYKQYEQHVKEK